MWAVGIRRAGTCHGNMYLLGIRDPLVVLEAFLVEIRTNAVPLFICLFVHIERHVIQGILNIEALTTNTATDANHQFKQTLSSEGPFKVNTSSEKDQLDVFTEPCRGHHIG